MKTIKLVYSNKQYGFIYENQMFDVNTLEKIDCNKYVLIKPELNISEELYSTRNKEFIKKLKSLFPYTKLHDDIIKYNLNWEQSFIIIDHKDMNLIISEYPTHVIKQLIKFIENVVI